VHALYTHNKAEESLGLGQGLDYLLGLFFGTPMTVYTYTYHY